MGPRQIMTLLWLCLWDGNLILTHRARTTQKCVSKQGHHWFRKRLETCDSCTLLIRVICAFFCFSFCFVFVFGYRGHIEQHSFKLLNICRLSSLKNRLIHRRSDVYFLESKPWMHGGKLDSLLGNLLTSMLVVLFDLISRRAFSLIEAERRIFASANCAIITSDNGLHLFAARLSFEPKLVSSQLDYEEHMSMKLYL